MSFSEAEEATALTFRDYQTAALDTDQVKGSARDGGAAIMVPLLGLAGEAGSLLTEFKKWLRQGEIYRPFEQQVSDEIGDILWYLANIASKMDLDIEEIARENLAKLADRWGRSDRTQALLFGVDSQRYDGTFPPEERLPCKLVAEFRMVMEGGRQKLALSIDGQDAGDALTDNAHIDDGYRFHDCFHITVATMLRWSPVMRKLLRCKRKSNPSTDEVEDGARAKITEEAISAVVYGFSKDFGMFENAASVEYELLRTVRMMARAFEVRDRTAHEWEKAILEAFKIWRQLIANQGGKVVADAETRSVEYFPLK